MLAHFNITCENPQNVLVAIRGNPAVTSKLVVALRTDVLKTQPKLVAIFETDLPHYLQTLLVLVQEMPGVANVSVQFGA